ncbi:MAG: hypothetical protein KF878_08415 [Planctomycetes bacterium]|nr:hypothetical protein [Planctomycetota bacterium]
MKRRETRGAALLTGLCALVLTTGVRADQQDDKKKAEREWREAEEGQGKKKQDGQPGIPGLGENPLEKILELMRGVEDRLFESDTGEFTQDEQRKIIEAMRFEDKTSQALEELIRKIEEEMQKQQQQQSSGGGSEQQQRQRQRQQQRQQQETEQERQQRMERERQEEERRRMQQQNQPQQQQQQNQPQNDREQRGQQERREGRPPEDPARADPRERERAGRWGQLPAKLHQDAQNAQNQDPPARWADLIKRYRTRMGEGGRE